MQFCDSLFASRFAFGLGLACFFVSDLTIYCSEGVP
jgi:hypothetical protein